LKKILLIALLLIVGCVPPRLVEKDGLWYAPKTDIPYSGKWTWWYDNGQKWSEGTFKDGKEDGLVAELYRNGQKKEEGTWKNGEPDGKWTYWSADGRESSELIFKNGEGWNGKETYWWDNGQKYREGTYKDGKWISKCWDEDGNEMDCPPAEEVE